MDLLMNMVTIHLNIGNLTFKIHKKFLKNTLKTLWCFQGV